MTKMGQILEIDVYSDIFITYFFYRCNFKNYGEVTLDEYLKGLASFDVNSLSEVKSQ